MKEIKAVLIFISLLLVYMNFMIQNYTLIVYWILVALYWTCNLAVDCSKKDK